MAYQREQWRSGLTYQQTCEKCRTVVRYMDDKLDFRPWYADGFVYCPTCNSPLRHNERFAINSPDAMPYTAQPVAAQDFDAQPAGTAAFCTNCGKKFNEGDRFCSGCGAKRG